MNRLTIAILITTATFVVVDSAHAQNLTLQQPVQSRFGVRTSVSVPDRGQAHLGSISRAGESSKRFGPFRGGTSTGFFRDHASTSTSVFIHDLREMDRMILSGTVKTSRSSLDAKALHAYTALKTRSRLRALAQREARSTTTPSTSAKSPANTVDKAAKFLSLGKRAIQRGQLSVARMHLKMAKKYGSPFAELELARLSNMKPKDIKSANAKSKQSQSVLSQ